MKSNSISTTREISSWHTDLSLAFRVLMLLAACLVWAANSGYTSEARSASKITRANFKLASVWSVEKQFQRTKDLWIVPYWLSNQDRFLYRYADRQETSYYLVDAATKTKSQLFDREKVADQLLELSGKEYDWKNLPIRQFEFKAEDSAVVFGVDEQKYCYSFIDSVLKPCDTSSEPTPPGLISTSPDGRTTVILRDHNLYLARCGGETDSLVQITHDGAEYNDEFATIWSPDSRCFAILRQDWREVEDLWLINPLSDPRPTLETFKWPMPGENIEQYSLSVYECESGRLVEIETDRWADQTLFQVDWSPDARQLYFTRLSRDWLSLDLCAADPSNGESRTLIEERGIRQFYYEIRPQLRILETTGELIWWSWAEGWGHYYLYSADGELMSRLTDGLFNADRIVHCDEDDRVLYFMGNAREDGRNPYNHYLYRVNFDGSDMRLLTPEDAEHEIFMSNSGKFLVDIYSRPDLRPHAIVRDNSGNPVMELESADISQLVDAGWKEPVMFRALAADDSTELWGVLYRPFDFDPHKKYPTIVYGYPGKETEFIPLRFYGNAWMTVVSTALAQYGFIVAVFGNRGGTVERSYDYYNYGWDDLRDYSIADKKHVMLQLAERYEWIDIDRVGVMGSSSGGFFAAAAILTEPDFFKVAVAKSGNHDNNLYYHHWNERYGEVTEVVDEEGRVTFESRSPSNNDVVENLMGRLLIVQGDMDHYVPPSQSACLANSLIQANKRFDQFIIPGGDHFFGRNWQYLIRYIELYFVENLMGDDRWSVDIFADPDSAGSE